MKNSNEGATIKKTIKAAFWCIQQNQPFTFADFVLANSGHRKNRPGRILRLLVEADILESDDSARKKSHIMPVWYVSRWLVKDKDRLRKKYGKLKKGLTRKSECVNGKSHENCDDTFDVDGTDSCASGINWD